MKADQKVSDLEQRGKISILNDIVGVKFGTEGEVMDYPETSGEIWKILNFLIPKFLILKFRFLDDPEVDKTV